MVEEARVDSEIVIVELIVGGFGIVWSGFVFVRGQSELEDGVSDFLREVVEGAGGLWVDEWLSFRGLTVRAFLF